MAKNSSGKTRMTMIYWKKAFSWYEDKRPGLGHGFLLQVDAGLELIERNPEIYPPEYKRTRKHVIKRFPYKVVYLLEKERIVVLAVIHGKRGWIIIIKCLRKRCHLLDSCS
jgi:plasmid stabilization system protein ParE